MLLLYSGQNNELPAGEHEFGFYMTLPKVSPSTFNGLYGRISYYAEAKLIIPWSFNATRRKEFIVKNRIDLNNAIALKVISLCSRGRR